MLITHLGAAYTRPGVGVAMLVAVLVSHTPRQETAGTFQASWVSAGKNYRWLSYGISERARNWRPR